jgi:ribosomal protein L7/L12
MIKVDFTVREALNLVSGGCDRSMYEKIAVALEKALGVDNRCSLTITNGMDTNNRIKCIKVIRAATGMDLRDAKSWTDVLVGQYDDAGRWLKGGSKNTLKMSDNESAKKLLRELTDLGCEGYLC